MLLNSNKSYLFNLLLLVALIFVSWQNSSAQSNTFTKSFKIEKFLKVDSISDIEISNKWTNKTWTLSPTNLIFIKNKLKHSKVTNGPTLKPGHLYMRIKLKNATDYINDYEIYMYPNGSALFLDPGYDETKQKFIVVVELPSRIKWDNLK